MQRTFLLTSCALIAVAVAAPSARADRDEAQWSARPLVGFARVREDGAPRSEREMVGGAAVGLSYGLTDHLDLGAELITFGATRSTFPDTMFSLERGTAVSGTFTRRSGASLLVVGPTWRLGVVWVPVVTVAVGAGTRYRSDGGFRELNLYPPERSEGLALDFAVLGRVGLERRLTRRLTVGAYAAALAAGGPSVPMLPVASVSLGVSYTHYPLW